MQLLDGEYRLARGLQRAVMDATLQLIYPKHSSFTGVLEEESSPQSCIGQIQIDDESSRLIFIFPEDIRVIHDLCKLVEGLGVRAGAMGAHYLLAAVEESNPLHFALCQCSYHPLFTQKFWKIDPIKQVKSPQILRWQAARSQDLIAVQSLLNACLPPQVQPIWQLKPQRFPDYILSSASGLAGIVNIHRHGETTFVYPLIHPDFSKPEESLEALLPQIQGKEMYLLIPSFQSILERSQNKFKAVTVLKQTVMVKYFVLHQKKPVEVEEGLLSREKLRKPGTPVARTISREKY